MCERRAQGGFNFEVHLGEPGSRPVDIGSLAIPVVDVVRRGRAAHATTETGGRGLGHQSYFVLRFLIMLLCCLSFHL